MIGNDWDNELKIIWDSPNFHKFWDIIMHEYATKDIFPAKENIFNALKLTPYSNVKVVIVGQDPYHGVGEAHGLSFSVQEGVPIPPSLRNIFKELELDLGIKKTTTDLTSWANQGVLLLNSIMTVVKDSPLSHKARGWEIFTDKIIEKLGERQKPVVFILWGSYARSKKELIKGKNHYIIESVHPSPLSASRGFFGSKPFSKTNNFLRKNGIKEIDW